MSEKVRVGIIGTRWGGDRFHLPSLKSHPDVVLAAVCGRNRDRAEKLAGKYGVARVFTDYRKMLNSGELDAAIVASPDDLHYPMVMAALEARLHVVCEKPLANSAAQAKKMVEKAQSAGVKHMLMFTLRGAPHYRYMKQLLEDGHIGQLYHGHFH